MQTDFFGSGPSNFSQIDKPKLRAWVRQNIKTPDIQGQTASLLAHLTDFLQGRSGLWTSYRAGDSAEPNLSRVPDTTKQISWAYPRLIGSELQFYFSPEQKFVENKFGIEEPPADEKLLCPLVEVTGMLIPGMAFSPQGGRLGRGKGYYDRVLADFKGLKVGVCFNEFIFNHLPEESHDMRMDFIVTPLGVIIC